jgi:23S rRNA (guanine745-N1)-methyltransferase
MSVSGGVVRCEQWHSFDVARHGYVNLTPGDARPGRGDTAAMIVARRDFLSKGHYAPIAREVVGISERSADTVSGCLVDLGAGTGHYLAAVLDRLNERVGIALDVSKFAARVAAGEHPLIGAVVSDVWGRLPVRSDSAALVLNIFSPRNAAEAHRILRPDGTLVVVTPTPDHMRELVGALDLISVDESKEERLRAHLDPHFEPTATVLCEFKVKLEQSDVEAFVAMGPSAWHADAATMTDRIRNLSIPIVATASVTVTAYRKC